MQKGLEAAEKAVRLAPDNADTHFLLGSMMFRVGQLEEAIAEYRTALQLSEKHRKHAIYSQASMMDTLSQAVAVSDKHEVIEAASGEQFESMLSDRLKETTKDISRSKVLSEVTSTLVE